MLKFLLTFFLICSVFFIRAQKNAYQSYSLGEGLPQSQVTAIGEDSDGYLWVGTLGGAARYNGDRFDVFSTENGLLSNRISAINTIGDSLFLGHEGGISILYQDSIYPFSTKELQGANVSAMVQFKNQIFIASNGAGLFVLTENGEFEKVTSEENGITFIRSLCVYNEELFLATRKGLVSTTDGNKYTLTNGLKDLSLAALSLKKNQLLVTSFSDQVYALNLTSKKISVLYENTEKIRMRNSYVDSKGTLWLSTQKGLMRCVKNNVELIDQKKGLPTNLIDPVFEDSEGNLWIGTQGKGVLRAPIGGLVYFDSSTGLSSDLVISGFAKQNGNYRIGTFDKGVVIYNAHKKSFRTIELPYSNTVWAAINNIDGKDWFGTASSLIALDDEENITEYSVDEGLPGYKITTLFKINAKEMYVGGSKGVVKYSNNAFHNIASNPSEIGTVRSIASVKNQLYVGTDFGLYCLRNGIFEQLELDAKVFSLLKDKKNNLWVGTENGLFLIDHTESLKQIKYADEVASNFINFLNFTEGNLIIGSNNGLYLLSEQSNFKEVKHIGLTEGLIELETNINSSFIDHQGMLWFGTAEGLVRMNLKEFAKGQPIATIHWNSILLNYANFDYQKFAEKIEDGLPIGLSFPYNKNNLTFVVDAISLSNYASIDFQYLLEGAEEDWSPLTKGRSVNYTGLSPGEYTLHTRIVDYNGRVLDETAMQFEIRPPFYFTWWFILCVTLLLIAIIYWILQNRIRREREKNEKERLEFKSRLLTLEQKSLNASMNRHFIFNSLNSIQYFINTSDKLSANKYLTNFAKLIRKNLDSSTVQEQGVTLAEEIERIELYLLLESMRFKDAFEYTISTNGIDLEEIKIPGMLIQPFVENSIIHGILPNEETKGELKIEVEVDETQVLVHIKDNGIGIDKSLKRKNEFYGDHKSQGMEITFKRIDLIRKMSNSKLEIIGPRQINNPDGSVVGTDVTLKILAQNLEN